MKEHSQTISKIFGKSADIKFRSLKHTISDLFQGWFCFLQRSLIKPSQLDYIEAKTKQIESYQRV